MFFESAQFLSKNPVASKFSTFWIFAQFAENVKSDVVGIFAQFLSKNPNDVGFDVFGCRKCQIRRRWARSSKI
jgi:hypothetical protein